MPKAIVTVRDLKNKDTGIDISIPTYTESPGLFANSVEFHIVVVTNLRCFKLAEHDDHDVVQFMVKKSQSELEQFYAKMERNYPGTVFPSLQRKSFLTEVSTINLKISFEKFMQFLAMTSKLCTCPVLLQFFGSDPIKAGRYSRENSRHEAGVSIDIFEEARHEQNLSPAKPTRSQPKRPSIFDEDDSDQPPQDLFTTVAARDENDFDLLTLAKVADIDAQRDKPCAQSNEEGEREKNENERESKTSADDDHLKLFADCDYGGALRKDDQSLFILPGSTSLDADLSNLDLEDHSALLDIADDVDSLFQKQTEPAKPKPASKPRPAVKPKPQVKPKTEIKPDASEPEIVDTHDIMKYIRENTVDSGDVDLFS